MSRETAGARHGARAALLLLLATASAASAQLDLRLPAPAIGFRDSPSPAALAETRHANAAQHRREGRWVFGWGLASAIVGGALAPAWR